MAQSWQSTEDLLLNSQEPGVAVPGAAGEALALAVSERGPDDGERSESDSLHGLGETQPDEGVIVEEQIHSDAGEPTLVPDEQTPPTRPSTQIQRGEIEELESGDGLQVVWKEWKSPKLHLAWLFFQFAITLSLAATLTSLVVVSRTYSGFVRLGPPPGFLADNPDLLKAVWTQGLQYTTLPTLLMTIYRMMWDGTLAAVAERQPFVELRKPLGGGPDVTVLLDYKASSLLTSPYKAVRLGHFFLASCMAMSVVLTLMVVPGTAFLFTTQTASFNYSITVTSTHEFDLSVIVDPLRNQHFPVRTALDWTAAADVLKAPPVDWTNGTAAYPRFNLPNEPPGSNAPGDILVSTNSRAYFARPGCVALQEGMDFTGEIWRPPLPAPVVSVLIRGRDRGCEFKYDLLFNLGVSWPYDFRSVCAKTFHIPHCGDGGSRIIFISGNYTGDRANNHSVSNISVISCQPTYWIVPGQLKTSIDQAWTLDSLRIASFEGDWDRAMEMTDPNHMFFEDGLIDPISFDPTLLIQVPTTEFSRYVFQTASGTGNNTENGLRSDKLRDSMSNLLERSYASLAASLFTMTLETPIESSAVATMQDTRVIIVEPVAFFVLACFLCVAILQVGIMLYVRQPSALFEEPAGLISIAGVAQRSANLADDIKSLYAERGFKGNFRERAVKSKAFMKTTWHYHETERHIYDTERVNGGGMLGR